MRRVADRALPRAVDRAGRWRSPRSSSVSRSANAKRATESATWRRPAELRQPRRGRRRDDEVVAVDHAHHRALGAVELHRALDDQLHHAASRSSPAASIARCASITPASRALCSAHGDLRQLALRQRGRLAERRREHRRRAARASRRRARRTCPGCVGGDEQDADRTGGGGDRGDHQRAACRARARRPGGCRAGRFRGPGKQRLAGRPPRCRTARGGRAGSGCPSRGARRSRRAGRARRPRPSARARPSRT